MKRLKTILQSNKIYYILIGLTILITAVRILQPSRTFYTKNTNKITGIIRTITYDEDKIDIIIKSKEKIKGTYYLKEEEKLEKLRLGDKITVTGTLEIPQHPTTKNLFDYAAYLKKQKIYHLMEIEDIKKISSSKNWFIILKNKIYEKISHPYLQAFLLGNDDKVTEEVKNSYQENGISHLFAISGMQFYLLASFLLKILNKLKIKEKKSYILVFIFLLGYLSILGITASILRGILIFILNSINRVWHLGLKREKIIILTIVITILVNPYFLTEAAFWYSFLISIGLLYTLKQNDSYWKTLWKSSIFSFLISIPISLFYFYEINILSIFYNLFYIPFINIIIFPMSILTLFLPIIEPIYQILITILEESSLLLQEIEIGKYLFPKVIFLVYLLELFLIIYYIKTKKKRFLILLISILSIHHCTFYLQKDFIKIIDVGQGDAILIFSKGKTALIDTGGIIKFDGTKSSTISKYKTIPLLKSLGIKELNFALLTHGDYDHVGEFFYLNEHIKIEEVYINLGRKSSIEKEIIKERQDIKPIKQNQDIQIGNFTLYQLNKSWKEENAASSVYYVVHPNLTGLLMGDATVETEDYLLSNYNLKVDFIKIGHHGSSTSSSRSFLKEVNPSLALISVGKNNRYHHPSKEVLDNLTAKNIPYLQTATSGTITIYPKTGLVTEDKKER